MLLTLRVLAGWTGSPETSTCATSSAREPNPRTSSSGPQNSTSRSGTRFRSPSTWKLGSDTWNVTSSFPAQSSNSTAGKPAENTQMLLWLHSQRQTERTELSGQMEAAAVTEVQTAEKLERLSNNTWKQEFRYKYIAWRYKHNLSKEQHAQKDCQQEAALIFSIWWITCCPAWTRWSL